MRPHLKYLFGCLFLTFLITVTGCSSEPPPGPAEAPKVSVRHPEKQEIPNYVEFNGWLQPDKTLEVRARVRGHIHKVHFTDGQMVKKGDLLFEIDPRPFKAALETAEAHMTSAEASLELAKREYARTSYLATKGAAPREEVEVWMAKQAVAAAQKGEAKAAVDRAKLDLEYARVTADVAGRVGKAELTEGNLVNAGGSDPLLTTVLAIDPIRLYFNVDERSLQRYARNVGAAGKNLTEMLAALKDSKAGFTFALDGETEFPHTGTLRFSDNRIDPSTGTIQVYGVVPNKDGGFVSGSRVRVRLPAGEPALALLVPETAILADQDKRYVLIVDEQKNVRRRNVTLGRLTDDGRRAIQPADKLAEGEKAEDWWVVVDNLQRARLNYPVDPQKLGQPPSAPKSGQ